MASLVISERWNKSTMLENDLKTTDIERFFLLQIIYPEEPTLNIYYVNSRNVFKFLKKILLSTKVMLRGSFKWNYLILKAFV